MRLKTYSNSACLSDLHIILAMFLKISVECISHTCSAVSLLCFANCSFQFSACKMWQSLSNSSWFPEQNKKTEISSVEKKIKFIKLSHFITLCQILKIRTAKGTVTYLTISPNTWQCWYSKAAIADNYKKKHHLHISKQKLTLFRQYLIYKKRHVHKANEKVKSIWINLG